MAACFRISSNTGLNRLIICNLMKIHASHNPCGVGAAIAGKIHKGKSENCCLKPSVYRCFSALFIGNDPGNRKITVSLKKNNGLYQICRSHKLILRIWSAHKGGGQYHVVIVKILSA